MNVITFIVDFGRVQRYGMTELVPRLYLTIIYTAMPDESSFQKNKLMKRLMHAFIINKQVDNLINNIVNHDEQISSQAWCSLFGFCRHQHFGNFADWQSSIIMQIIYKKKKDIVSACFL